MKSHLVRVRKGMFVLVGAAVVAISAACGEDVTVPEQSAAVGAAVASAPAREMMASGKVAALSATDASAAPAADQAASANPAAIVAPTMVIRNGSASVEVDSLELAMAALQKLAAALGGYVGNTSVTSGAFAVRSAELELKIPSARYEDAIGGLTPIGKVESQTSTAEDVGEEFVDVQARQANARKLEERLIALLATRTGKLEDVLAVERELARVREEIERYEGRLRYLKSNIATSTLRVTVHEKRPIVNQYAGQNVIVESFKNAWRIFVSFVAALISALGWIIPLGAILAVVVVLGRRWQLLPGSSNSSRVTVKQPGKTEQNRSPEE